MIFMGTGGDFAPYTPHIDALMGLRLRARGFRGTRDESVCLYGSLSRDHALEYARDEKEEFLRILSPQPGAVVSWAPGIHDLILKFEDHLRKAYWGRQFSYGGLRFESLARDVAGDINIAETYLALGRQKKAIGAMIDMFLDEVHILEHVFIDNEALHAALAEHNGEVWITGPCLVSNYVPPDTVLSASM
jgi:hypothetical protein